MDASEELFVTLSTGVRICYQTFGDPSNPAIVFITGHSGSMLEWQEDMIELFNPAGGPQHYIIRFDNSDTGLSTEFPVPGGYTLEDMAGDIEGLVDHLGCPQLDSISSVPAWGDTWRAYWPRADAERSGA